MVSAQKRSVHWMLRPRPRGYEAWRKKIANKIRVEVIEAGWDWSDLATEAGVGLSTVTKFLEYRTKLPHAITLWKIADALGFTLAMEEK